jgi:hypothetical protein
MRQPPWKEALPTWPSSCCCSSRGPRPSPWLWARSCSTPASGNHGRWTSAARVRRRESLDESGAEPLVVPRTGQEPVPSEHLGDVVCDSCSDGHPSWRTYRVEPGPTVTHATDAASSCAAIAARSCFRLTRPAWRATALTRASHATRALRGDLPHQRRASPYSHVQATVAELRSVRLAAGRSLDIGLHERKLGRPSAQRRWSS